MATSQNEDDFTIFFETGAKTTVSAGDLARMVTDGRSWWAFLQMVCGGPPALMVVNTTNGQKGTLKAVRTGSVPTNASFDTL